MKQGRHDGPGKLWALPADPNELFRLSLHPPIIRAAAAQVAYAEIRIV
jgi:hypothetical protein